MNHQLVWGLCLSKSEDVEVLSIVWSDNRTAGSSCDYTHTHTNTHTKSCNFESSEIEM